MPKYPDAGAYCSGRAQAECNDGVVAACALASKDKCVTNRTSACMELLPIGKAYDPSKAEDCINKVGAAYEDAKLTKDEIETYGDSCELIFGGTGVKDAPCDVDADCKLSDGLRCVLKTSSSAAAGDAGTATVSGTCQLPVTVQGGGSCAAVDAMCAEGFHCGVTSHCDINGGSGEACSDALPCQTTFKCGTNGTCEAKLPDGQSCTSSGDCTNGICLEGTNICVSQITFAPNEPFCTQAR